MMFSIITRGQPRSDPPQADCSFDFMNFVDSSLCRLYKLYELYGLYRLKPSFIGYFSLPCYQLLVTSYSLISHWLLVIS